MNVPCAHAFCTCHVRVPCAHALCACPAHVPCASALRTCPVHVPCARAVCTCPVPVPCAHAVCTCPVHVPCARAPGTCPLRVPCARALCTCLCLVHVSCARALCTCLVHAPCARALCKCPAHVPPSKSGFLFSFDVWFLLSLEVWCSPRPRNVEFVVCMVFVMFVRLWCVVFVRCCVTSARNASQMHQSFVFLRWRHEPAVRVSLISRPSLECYYDVCVKSSFFLVLHFDFVMTMWCCFGANLICHMFAF